MIMEYLGLIFELLLLAIGVYTYLFAIGKFKVSDPDARKRMEDFRRKNAWLRYAGLALTAIMLVNIYLHLVALF